MNKPKLRFAIRSLEDELEVVALNLNRNLSLSGSLTKKKIYFSFFHGFLFPNRFCTFSIKLKI